MSIHARLNSTKVAVGAFSLVAALALATLTGVGAAHADGDPGDAEFLDTAETYVIIASQSITETSGSEVHGDVAVTPGSAQGLDPAQVDGEIYTASDAPGQIAALAASNAYDTLEAAANPVAIAGGDLTSGFFLAGVYNSASSMDLATNQSMTIHGVTADDVFIFQVGSALTMNVGSVVSLTGLAQACNVYWQVGSDATIGVNSQFVGTVIARSSITVGTNAVIEGRLFALDGSVTLDDNEISTHSRCVRTSTVGTVTTTTTREAGEVEVTVVDSATPPDTETETPPTTTAGSSGGSSSTGTFRRPTSLQNTGTLPNTGAELDLSVPMIAVGLMLLLGLALVAVPRVIASRKS